MVAIQTDDVTLSEAQYLSEIPHRYAPHNDIQVSSYRNG